MAALTSGGRGGQLDRAWRAGLRKEVERDYRQKARAKIKQHRADIKAAKATARAAVKAVTEACRRVRTKNREYIKEKRTAARLLINEERDQLFGKSRSACLVKKAGARERADGKISASAAALAEERGELGRRVLYAKSDRDLLPGGAKVRPRGEAAREAQAESDSEVESDIDHALIPVWRRIKRKIKAGPRQSRTEAFEHWVMENQGDVIRWQEEAATADIDAMTRAHNAEQQAAWEASGAQVAAWNDQQLVDNYDGLRAAEGDVPF